MRKETDDRGAALQLVFDPRYQSERLRSDIIEIKYDQGRTPPLWHIRQPRHNILVGFNKGHLDAKLPCRLLNFGEEEEVFVKKKDCGGTSPTTSGAGVSLSA